MNFQPSFGSLEDKNAWNEQRCGTKYQIYNMYSNFMPRKKPPEYSQQIIDRSYYNSAVYHGQHLGCLIYAVKKRHGAAPFLLAEELGKYSALLLGLLVIFQTLDKTVHPQSQHACFRTHKYLLLIKAFNVYNPRHADPLPAFYGYIVRLSFPVWNRVEPYILCFSHGSHSHLHNLIAVRLILYIIFMPLICCLCSLRKKLLLRPEANLSIMIKNNGCEAGWVFLNAFRESAAGV